MEMLLHIPFEIVQFYYCSNVEHIEAIHAYYLLPTAYTIYTLKV